MEAISAPHSSTSKKIRALHDAGYSRSAIAGFLRKGYQHVRNVLATPSPPTSGAPGVAEGAPAAHSSDDGEAANCGVFEVDGEGRIALTAALLKAVDGLPSRRVPWRFENGELILMSIDAASRQIDRLMSQLKRRPASAVDELIAERRAEFEREERRVSGRGSRDE
jgi:hypothetical protein